MAKSYYSEEELTRIVDELQSRGGEAPLWVLNVLRQVPSVIAAFPPIDDAERYVVEYVYPH